MRTYFVLAQWQWCHNGREMNCFYCTVHYSKQDYMHSLLWIVYYESAKQCLQCALLRSSVFSLLQNNVKVNEGREQSSAMSSKSQDQKWQHCEICTVQAERVRWSGRRWQLNENEDNQLLMTQERTYQPSLVRHENTCWLVYGVWTDDIDAQAATEGRCTGYLYSLHV